MDITYAHANKNIEMQAPQTAAFEEEVELDSFPPQVEQGDNVLASLAKYIESQM